MSGTSFPVVCCVVVCSGTYKLSSSKISSGMTMLGKPFLCNMIGTMFANFFALYLAAIKLTCIMACIFGFMLGVNALWVGGCGGIVVQEEGAGRLGVEV